MILPPFSIPCRGDGWGTGGRGDGGKDGEEATEDLGMRDGGQRSFGYGVQGTIMSGEVKLG